MIWVTTTGVQSISGELLEVSERVTQNGVYQVRAILNDASITDQVVTGLENFVGMIFLPGGIQLGYVKTVSSGQTMSPRLNATGMIQIGEHRHYVTVDFWTLDAQAASTLNP